jgi:MFS family permease
VPKNQWAFSLLWINLAVGVVALVQIASNQISTVPELLHVLAYELAYANLTGALGVLVIGGIAQRLAGRKFSMVRLFAVSVVVLTAVGCLIAQTLFMSAGFIARQNFWHDYFQKLRIAMPLAVVFGFGALAYGTLRERAQWMEKEPPRKGSRRRTHAETGGGSAAAFAGIADSPPFFVQHLELHQLSDSGESGTRGTDCRPASGAAAGLPGHQPPAADSLA